MASLQKRLASKVLKVGVSRVWIDPEKREDVEKAITKWDIRKLVKKGDIKALPEKLHRPKERTKKKRGMGSRKGKKYSIVPRKRRWISTIRPLRRLLKELKSSGEIDNQTYRRMRLLAKGGMFRSRSHLRTYLEQHDLLKKK
jgi:large subunit ribosomal protein L19e